jgi:MFS family permease
MDRSPPRRVLVALCITQVTSWGVLYYAFPVLLSSLTADTGWSGAAAMGAFSTGAITAAVAGVGVGRLIDRYGPRPVMTPGSVLGVLAVLAIAGAPSLPLFFAAWVLAGVAQSAVLYPPAFAALTGWYGPDRVRALTTLTLVAGLSSTMFAPLTAVLLDHLQWRAVYVVLACVLAVVTIPLHALCLTPSWPSAKGRSDAAARPGSGLPSVLRSPRFLALSAAMATAAFGMYAATINLVALFTSRGMTTHLAALGLGLCGAGQVLGRLGYSPLTRSTSPYSRTVAVVACGAVMVVGLGLVPGPVVLLIIVAVAAGAVRGILTLLQATAVADRWGTRDFGRVNGAFIAPTTAMIALAPGGGSLLAQLLGGFPIAYAVLALLTLVSAAAVAVADRVRPGPGSREECC